MQKWLTQNYAGVALARSDAFSVAFYVDGRYIRLTREGVLTVQGISRYDREADAIKAKLGPVLEGFALELANARFDNKIRSLGTVTEDRRMPNGARLITVTV